MMSSDGSEEEYLPSREESEESEESVEEMKLVKSRRKCSSRNLMLVVSSTLNAKRKHCHLPWQTVSHLNPQMTRMLLS